MIWSWIHCATELAARPAIRALQLSAGSRGFDVGCGIGAHILWLAEAVSLGEYVIGIDISKECLVCAEAMAAFWGKIAERR
ncbi:MAG: class I SAM-dependent methyltransferase [Anaerolineae bacterium]|nr:class I SAM-dependent methyltransferase [Anaerolineae bacterium]